MRTAALALVIAVVALAACSKSKAPVDSEPALAQQPAQKTVFDTQMKALQKAKDVQKTVDQQKNDLDKQLKDTGE
jgi:hypothetical protein